MRTTILFLALASFATACAASPADDAASSGDQAATSGAHATFALSSDHNQALSGAAQRGAPIEIDYALDRLPQCRGNVGGGGPGWDITGFWSQNGEPAKSFAVTKLSADGTDRVSAPAIITPTEGGDIALWFQVTSVFGCSEYDSDFGNNFHIKVAGGSAPSLATITFDASGAPTVEGTLKAGGKVAVHYEPARLSSCESYQGGYPQYGISGHSSLNGGADRPFETGHAEAGKLVASDATIDLPASGDLALWFETTSTYGCHAFDSSNGANYHFSVE